VSDTRVTKARKHDRHQVIEDTEVIGLHGREHSVREVYRIGFRVSRYGPESLASCPEDVPDRAVAIVNAVENRVGEVHESPHQVERQIGMGLSDPVDDHRPLQIKIFHKVPTLLPVDKRPRRAQSGEALANLGSDNVTAGLRRQLQSQAPFDFGIAVRKFNEDRGKALSPKRC